MRFAAGPPGRLAVHVPRCRGAGHARATPDVVFDGDEARHCSRAPDACGFFLDGAEASGDKAAAARAELLLPSSADTGRGREARPARDGNTRTRAGDLG